jgi:integrase
MARNVDGVYTRKDRPGYWISWNDAQGRRRYRKTNAETLSQAKAIRSRELVKVEQGRVLGFAPPGEESFQEVSKRFLSHQKVRLTERAYVRQQGIVENHLGVFFKGPVASIRKLDVQRYITKRAGEVSPYSVQKEVNTLKHMLGLCVEWEIIPISPAQRVKLPKAPAGRVRYLQPTELRTLLQAAPEWLRPIIALAVSTGMRRGEILSLRWLDVDMSGKRILIPQTKNGDGRVVYLNKTACLALGSIEPLGQRNPLTKVFENLEGEWVSVAFQRACKAAKIQDFRFHDLRHTAASWMRMNGSDIHTVAQLLGHKDLRMAARYQHLSPDYLSKAVATLDSAFGVDYAHLKGATAGKG